MFEVSGRGEGENLGVAVLDFTPSRHVFTMQWVNTNALTCVLNTITAINNLKSLCDAL
jgi:hypothetical protein